jgi:hypothetical protein
LSKLEDRPLLTPCATIRLPNTCPENKRSYTHCRILTEVRTDAWNGAGFEGPLFRPGAKIPPEDLGEQPVLLEFAGPQGKWRPGKHRENLWILWRYDWDLKAWQEIARAIANDWHWALILRGPAIRALKPKAIEQVDPAERGRAVTDELLHTIDAALVTEPPAVRMVVLSALYDRVAGRIVAA